VPPGRWSGTWVLALLITVALLGSWEVAGRRAGFVPSITDDVQAWTVMRGRVSDGSTVVIGTSRAQADLDLRVWADEVGGASPVNLTIAGGSVLPVLDELADIETFRGLVVADIIPRIEFDATRHREELTAPYLSAYEDVRRSPARYAEAHLRSAMPGMVFKNNGLSPRRVIGSVVAVVRGFRPPELLLPTPPYFSIRGDRYMSLDFSDVELAERVDMLIEHITQRGHPAVGSEVDDVLARVERAVRRIEDRGGRVVLVHFPHCGAIEELEERTYPRPQYWDRLESLGVGETIYTADRPSLGGFDCPDGSHLDTRDSAEFTRALVRIVVGSAG
jgi:hypothetical protein